MSRLSMLLLFCLVLGACTTAPKPVSPQAPEASRRDSANATPAITSPANPGVGAGAVDTLLDEARELRQSGDFDAALRRLERALRIEPQRAEVYLELARSYLAAGNTGRAAASADRGLLYCRGDSCRALRQFLAD